MERLWSISANMFERYSHDHSKMPLADNDSYRLKMVGTTLTSCSANWWISVLKAAIFVLSASWFDLWKKKKSTIWPFCVWSGEFALWSVVSGIWLAGNTHSETCAASVVLPQPALAVIQSRSEVEFSSQEIYFCVSWIQTQELLDRFRICVRNEA